MANIVYDGEPFVKITDTSAVRHVEDGSVKILNIEKDGTVTCRTRKAPAFLYQFAKRQLGG